MRMFPYTKVNVGVQKWMQEPHSFQVAVGEPYTMEVFKTTRGVLQL